MHVNHGVFIGRYEGDIYLTAASEQSPQESSNASSGQPTPDWWPGPGQTQQSWVMEPATVKEAERRLNAAGVLVSEIARARAMAVMASEAERTWPASSIESARRKAR